MLCSPLLMVLGVQGSGWPRQAFVISPGAADCLTLQIPLDWRRFHQGGESMRLSRYFLPLLKETPVEAAQQIQPVL